MRIHLIAVGGAVMHNIAIALYNNHHTVTGSDDEIYDPSRSRLQKYDLLPQKMGWDANRITKEIDLVILGMHARKDNPELARAIELEIPVLSFPEYIYQHAKDKTRVVVGGSHGKTTTTAMIMHVLRELNYDFDYAVGAQLDGFETMVRFSDAPIMVIEGDEYLSSPIDRRPKFFHYQPDIAILTGIAWDHINVFPTFENYLSQFEQFITNLRQNTHLFYFGEDEHIQTVLDQKEVKTTASSYFGFDFKVENNQTYLLIEEESVPIQIFGAHNIQNLNAAFLACQQIGVSKKDFFKVIQSFSGAAKRLETLYESKELTIFQDFAHAPSKVKATTKAVRTRFPEEKITACFELHTFSSLNKEFLPHYQHSLQAADQAIVYYSEHTLKIKRLPFISKADIAHHFDHPNLVILSDETNFQDYLLEHFDPNGVLLLMSSGKFGGTNLKELVEKLTYNL